MPDPERGSGGVVAAGKSVPDAVAGDGGDEAGSVGGVPGAGGGRGGGGGEGARRGGCAG